MNGTTQADRTSRATQRDRILALLESRAGGWVPLPEILSLRIACYSTRILELRRLGYRIENRREDGKSFFRLVKPVAAAKPEARTKPKPETASEELDLFSPADLAGARKYADPEETFR